MTSRRRLVFGGGALALLALAGCGKPPPGPGVVTVTANGSAGMNPGPGGADRPLTLTVVQLRGTQAFQNADVFALQSPATALGGELISEAPIALAPGGSGSAVITLDPAAAAIGIIAGYREPGGKIFRLAVPVKPGTDANIVVNVTGSGLALAPA